MHQLFSTVSINFLTFFFKCNIFPKVIGFKSKHVWTWPIIQPRLPDSVRFEFRIEGPSALAAGLEAIVALEPFLTSQTLNRRYFDVSSNFLMS